MSNFQFAIDNAKSIVISQQEITSTTISRNGNLTRGTVLGSRPYQIEVEMPDYLDAGNDEVKAFCAYMDNNAYVGNAVVKIAENNNLDYLLGYQGNATTAQLNDLTTSGYGFPGYANTANQSPPVQLTPSYLILTLYQNTSALIPSASTRVFETGDYIQISHPNGVGKERVYQVVDPVDGSNFYGTGGRYVDVRLNKYYTRIENYVIIGNIANINVGSGVEFNLQLINKPSYTIIPGGANNLIQFNDSLKFVEKQ